MVGDGSRSWTSLTESHRAASSRPKAERTPVDLAERNPARPVEHPLGRNRFEVDSEIESIAGIVLNPNNSGWVDLKPATRLEGNCLDRVRDTNSWVLINLLTDNGDSSILQRQDLESSNAVRPAGSLESEQLLELALSPSERAPRFQHVVQPMLRSI